VWRVLLRRIGRGIPRSRRSLRLPQPRSRSSLGISIRLDELVSRAARGHGHPGSRISTISRIPLPSCDGPLFTCHIGRIDFTFTAAQPLAALVVVAVTAINYLSVRMGGAIQVVLTSLKMGTIAVIVVAGALFGKHIAFDGASQFTHLGLGTISGFLTALVPAMWAYNGFNDLGDVGEEIAHAQKNIPEQSSWDCSLWAASTCSRMLFTSVLCHSQS